MNYIRQQPEEMQIPYKLHEDISYIETTVGSGEECFLFHSDVDAQAVPEEANVPFRATNGCMHGCAVFEELLEHGLLEHIADVSAYLEEKLEALRRQFPQIRRVCCKGLAASVEFSDQEVFETVCRKAKENGLIVGTGEHFKLVLRPPYVITGEDIDAVVSLLETILQ